MPQATRVNVLLADLVQIPVLAASPQQGRLAVLILHQHEFFRNSRLSEPRGAQAAQEQMLRVRACGATCGTTTSTIGTLPELSPVLTSCDLCCAHTPQVGRWLPCGAPGCAVSPGAAFGGPRRGDGAAPQQPRGLRPAADSLTRPEVGPPYSPASALAGAAAIVPPSQGVAAARPPWCAAGPYPRLCHAIGAAAAVTPCAPFTDAPRSAVLGSLPGLGLAPAFCPACPAAPLLLLLLLLVLLLMLCLCCLGF